MEGDQVPDDLFLSIHVASKDVKGIAPCNYVNLLNGYSEIHPRYLKFFFGCWIKYTNKKSKEYFSGGILTELNYKYGTVFLRTMNAPPNNTTRLNPYSNYIYYAKTDSEHYRSYLNIKLEYSKLAHAKKKIEETNQDPVVN